MRWAGGELGSPQIRLKASRLIGLTKAISLGWSMAKEVSRKETHIDWRIVDVRIIESEFFIRFV